VHHVALFVEAHAFNGKEIATIEVFQGGGLPEDIIDDFVLDHLEVDDSCDEREGGLILLVKWLDLEKGPERVLLLTFIELLVERELFLAGEDAPRELERLVAVLGVRSQRVQIRCPVRVHLT